jgi:Reverse transcriptase (RNA-dependent DNA polymerase)
VALNARAFEVAARAVRAIEGLHGPLYRGKPPLPQAQLQPTGQQPPPHDAATATSTEPWGVDDKQAAPDLRSATVNRSAALQPSGSAAGHAEMDRAATLSSAKQLAVGHTQRGVMGPRASGHNYCPSQTDPHTTKRHESSLTVRNARASSSEGKQQHTRAIAQLHISNLFDTGTVRQVAMTAARTFVKEVSRHILACGDANRSQPITTRSVPCCLPRGGGTGPRSTARVQGRAPIRDHNHGLRRPDEHLSEGGDEQKENNISCRAAASTRTIAPTQEREAYQAAMDHLKFTQYSRARPALEPIRAQDIGLPDTPGRVELVKNLPPSIGQLYSNFNPMLMRPTKEREERAAKAKKAGKRPIRPVTVQDHEQYIALLKRMMGPGMVTYTVEPKVVNGLFAVPKDGNEQRLIIDARLANEEFIDSPTVQLPTPDLTARLELDPSASATTPLYVAKVDLSNYYHQLRLPLWMQPYFALPPVKAKEVGQEVLTNGDGERLVWPCCTTLPMGFSHAVYLAQAVHEHAIATHAAFDARDAITASNDRVVNRVRHQTYIDDFILYGHDKEELSRNQQRYIATMRGLGFPIKEKKVVLPSADGVEALGMIVHGRRRTVGVAAHKLQKLVEETEDILHSSTCSGDRMAELVGSWTWASLARRPALAAFSSVYRYILTARGMQFNLWPSVQRELTIISGLAPLLYSKLNPSVMPTVIATDASSSGMGVVERSIQPAAREQLIQKIRPLEGQVQRREISALQAGFAAAEAIGQNLSSRGTDPNRIRAPRVAWTVTCSYRWAWREHINILEARAMACAVRYLSPRSKASGSRALLLCDSAVVTHAVNKGRSSAYRLLVQLRRIQAHALAYHVYLDVLWIPSEINPADGPSRAMTGVIRPNESN